MYLLYLLHLFATKIVKVENLGIFDRIYASEIDTYVDKIFYSELFKNVIDFCFWRSSL
jgi:hypothetical protein